MMSFSLNLHRPFSHFFILGFLALFMLLIFWGSSFGYSEPLSAPQPTAGKAGDSPSSTLLLLQISKQLQQVNQRLIELETKSGKRFKDLEQAVGIIQYNVNALQVKSKPTTSSNPNAYPDTADVSVGDLLLSEVNVSTNNTSGNALGNLDTNIRGQGGQTGSLLGRIQNMNPAISVFIAKCMLLIPISSADIFKFSLSFLGPSSNCK